jgi:putative ABC transport system ATP-binding protein
MPGAGLRRHAEGMKKNTVGLRSTPLVIRTRGLCKEEYGKGEGLVRALRGIDLDVGADQTLAIMGPSGCGKSTLLHLLGGLDQPSSGEAYLGGRRIDQMRERSLARLRRHDIGFVFQAFQLMDELTAAENIELPVLLAGRSPRTARRRAAALLKRVRLSERARHLPSALSAGQRQRVAVARALANEPLVILADEPTGNLDSAATADVLALFADLRAAGRGDRGPGGPNAWRGARAGGLSHGTDLPYRPAGRP